MILKSISKDPSQRYQSGKELARDLQACRPRSAAVLGPTSTIVSGDDPTIASTGVETPPLVAPVTVRRQRWNAGRIGLIVGLISILAMSTVEVIRTLKDRPPASTREEAQPPIGDHGLPPPPRDLPELLRGAEQQAPIIRPGGPVPQFEPPPGARAAGPSSREIGRRGAGQSPNPQPPPAEASADEPAPRGNKTPIGSPVRQKELLQSRDAARLLITSSALPEILTLVVRADDELLFRRNATASPAQENGRRRQSARGISSVPLAEERLLPPGNHKIQVVVFLGPRRAGQPQEVTAEFNSGERHTLDLQFSPEAPRGSGPDGESNRFRVTLK